MVFIPYKSEEGGVDCSETDSPDKLIEYRRCRTDCTVESRQTAGASASD